MRSIRRVVLLLLPFAARPLQQQQQQQQPRLFTASGEPVCRYALGGAARSSQPASLPASYVRSVGKGAYLFYYNPHRYPAFMQGVAECCRGLAAEGAAAESSAVARADLFISSGGGDRAPSAMEQRLRDALAACDHRPDGAGRGDLDHNTNDDHDDDDDDDDDAPWLDMFVLEYVCPEEMVEEEVGESSEGATRLVPGAALSAALAQASAWKEGEEEDGEVGAIAIGLGRGSVRYVGVSTHSHTVAAALAVDPAVDAVMLRYNMAHRMAAEALSLPAAAAAEPTATLLRRSAEAASAAASETGDNGNYEKRPGKPVIAFTTTRWNALLKATTTKTTSAPPTLGECLSYSLRGYCAGGNDDDGNAAAAMAVGAVDVVLHSARDERELRDALAALNLCNNLVENCTGLAVLQNMLQNGSGSSSDTDNGSCFPMSEEDAQRWRAYGDAITAIMQANDGFDEYPEEEEVVRRKEGA